MNLGQLVGYVEATLDGTAHDELNTLVGNMSASTVNAQETITLGFDLGGCIPGAYLSIEEESVYVLSASIDTREAVIVRGQKGTAPVAHTASSLMINVDPMWTRGTIMQALRDEIRSWGPQVFQVKTASIALAPGQMGYDLGDVKPFFRVLKVRTTPEPFIGSSFANGAVTATTSRLWADIPFDIDQAAPLQDFPSGSALFLRSQRYTTPGSLVITYACPFDCESAWTDSTDVVDVIGLDLSNLDIAAYGAAWRLLAFRVSRRLSTQQQGQPRDAQDVPALSLMQAAQQFKTIRDDRLNDAQAQLLSLYPLEMDVV